MPKFQAVKSRRKLSLAYRVLQAKLSCNFSWKIIDEEGVRMTVDFVMGLVTCVATVINTVFVALSYLKGKDKE